MSRELGKQIKQPKPFRSVAEEAFLNVMRTSAAFLGALADILRPHDLSQPQYNVLRILRGAGAAGLPSGEIGVRMVGRDPDVTRLLDRMESRGIVERERQQSDRRVIVARLTAEGLALVDALDPPVDEMHRRLLGHLSRGDLESMITLLERARNEPGGG